jgi:ParB-like chromosome segregation protein Spo0J
MPTNGQRRSIEALSRVSNGNRNGKLEIEMLSPNRLRPAQRNARTHNEAQIELLANSIVHFGFIKPVVIDDCRRIVAGHGIWMAA